MATVFMRTRLDVALLVHCLSSFVIKKALGLIIDKQDEDCCEFIAILLKLYSKTLVKQLYVIRLKPTGDYIRVVLTLHTI
jgi:hypothetical protein